MTEWQDPQTRAEAEDAMRDAEQADTREKSGKTVLVDGAQVFPPKELGHVDDTREKLEADVYDGFRALDETEQVRDIWRSRVHGWLDRQAAITRRETLLENPLHNNPYVGLVRGKQWERKESSDYYCGKCGWKVTDHDSYCPECGGALHRATNRPTSQSDAPKTEETAENGATKSEMRDFDDSREKLEADVEAHYTHTVSTAMWPESANKRTRYVSVPMDKVLGWLDRQEAITSKEWCHSHDVLEEELERERAERDEQQRSAVKLEAELRNVKEHADRQRVRISELEMLHVSMKAQRDALQQKVDALELRERCASDYDFRQAAEMWEEAFEDKCAELVSLQEKVDELQRRLAEHEDVAEKFASLSGGTLCVGTKAMTDKVAELTAERDRLLEQLDRVWLKDADGKPLHIGYTRYGEDGTEWHVTGFRWGSSHPVQGVDGKGRRRDLKPEWLRSEKPDSLGSLLEDVRRGALAYPRDRVSGYLEDNHSIGEAVLLDVRDRIEKMVCDECEEES